MRFETNPQLILTKDEFDTLVNALQLCREMDSMTSEDYASCENCPFKDDCSRMCRDCVYIKARDALKEIVDMAVVK